MPRRQRDLPGFIIMLTVPFGNDADLISVKVSRSQILEDIGTVRSGNFGFITVDENLGIFGDRERNHTGTEIKHGRALFFSCRRLSRIGRHR